MTHVCVIAPWNTMLLHSLNQLLKLIRCFSFLPQVPFTIQIPTNRYAKREMWGIKGETPFHFYGYFYYTNFEEWKEY
jgi:hypothetical protein